jgi:hypothetical protein
MVNKKSYMKCLAHLWEAFPLKHTKMWMVDDWVLVHGNPLARLLLLA